MLTKPEKMLNSNSPFSTTEDWIREGLKDVQVELMLLRQGLEVSGSQVQQSCRGITQTTSHSVRHLIKEQHHRLNGRWRELKTDFRSQQRLLHQDMRDFVAAGKSLKANIWERRQQEAASSSPPSSSCTTTEESTPKQETPEFFVQAIRDLEMTLQDPLFVTKLNNDVIPSHLSSCPEMVQYYHERPQLYDYTLTKELTRMSYTVYTETGQKLTETAAILDYAGRSSQRQNLDHDLLWRAANQSIFADVIISLTRDDDGLIRPSLGMASSVSDISILIDFARDTPHISAECFVQLVFPGRYHDDREEEEGIGNGSCQDKDVVAGALVGVYFCPSQNRMEAKVLHISPAPQMTDELVSDIAENVAGTAMTSTSTT